MFSNTERPSTQPVVKMNRPFTGALDPSIKFKPTRVPVSAGVAALAEDDPKLKLYEPARDLEMSLHFGKSINNSIFKQATNQTIINIDNYCDSMPQPKAKKGKKKPKKEEDEPKPDGDDSPTKKKAKKKKKEKASDLPPPVEWIK
jgi:hypothetical protein